MIKSNSNQEEINEMIYRGNNVNVTISTVYKMSSIPLPQRLIECTTIEIRKAQVIRDDLKKLWRGIIICNKLFLIISDDSGVNIMLCSVTILL